MRTWDCDFRVAGKGAAVMAWGMETHPVINQTGKRLMTIGLWHMQEPLLAATRRIAGKAVEMGFQDGYRWLMAEERRLHTRAGRLARLTARGAWHPGRVSERSEDLGFWVSLRAEAAHDWIIQTFPRMAKENPVPDFPDEWTPERACEWMMTEQWDCRRGAFLKLQLLEWLGPFPFYGDERAAEWE